MKAATNNEAGTVIWVCSKKLLVIMDYPYVFDVIKMEKIWKFLDRNEIL